MDTALQHHTHSRRVIIPYATSSSSTTPNHRPLSAQNARSQAGSAMPLTDLCMKRIITTKPPPIRLNHHRHHPKLFCVNTNNVSTLENNITMADDDEANNKESQFLNIVDKEANKEEKKVKESTPPPSVPPPEKPLPGDCCGSGCVRCVWDVYHEELQAYKQLYGKGSSDFKNSLK